MIEIVDVYKTFHEKTNPVHALKGVSLKIEEKEMTAIIGTSGSGKSTLMNIIGFMDRPTSGTYLFDNEESNLLNSDELAWLRNHRIGFVFQSFNLLARLSALDNVALPLLYRPDQCNVKEDCLEALTRVGLAQRVDHLPNELSGGEKQRVAIARALVTKPSIILADEPTGNLDFKTSKEIMGLFHELHDQGQTIIMVTHDPEVASQCSRAIRFQDGQIVSDSKVSS
ncbi:MAG: ABC transporter ATP-binding protein [Candidatus Cloacimonetes bacterium]|nr:ABC transporter ATP-binding protein [Candidatus Cloacimonadota bacterium]